MKDTLENDMLAAQETDKNAYSPSKFIQLLNAHWWRRQLGSQATVVAVSPGLIPGTGLGRYTDWKVSHDVADAKSVPQGK